MISDRIGTDLLRHLVERAYAPGERLPSLPDLSAALGVSVGKLREQLEVARQMGLVSVRPRLGTRREAYDFYPAVHDSLFFGLATGEATFEQYSNLRQILELSMWGAAVTRLTAEDMAHLRGLVAQAWAKLHGDPVHIPNGEHRELHLTIFRRLGNPFVLALLRAYWDAYDAIELTRFADYDYWLTVWSYHEQIVEAVCAGETDRGRVLLAEHFALLPTVTRALANGGSTHRNGGRTA
jgi:DNA-binding FadR family transcriptional regulator